MKLIELVQEKKQSIRTERSEAPPKKLNLFETECGEIKPKGTLENSGEFGGKQIKDC